MFTPDGTSSIQCVIQYTRYSGKPQNVRQVELLRPPFQGVVFSFPHVSQDKVMRDTRAFEWGLETHRIVVQASSHGPMNIREPFLRVTGKVDNPQLCHPLWCD